MPKSFDQVIKEQLDEIDALRLEIADMKGRGIFPDLFSLTEEEKSELKNAVNSLQSFIDKLEAKIKAE